MKRAIFLFLILFFVSDLKAQDPLGGAVLGVGLNNFANKINEAISRATAGGLILEINAGGQISLLIEQAKKAYQDELEMTFNQLNSTQRSAVNDLNSLTNEFVNKTYSSLNDLQSRVQIAINTLPFSDNFPQVSKWSPKYSIQDNINNLQILIQGNFFDVTREDYDASLIINNQNFRNAAKTTQTITFDIPKSSLNRNPSSITYNYLEIKIPFRVRTWIFFHRKEYATFKIPLVVLPERTGNIVYTFKTLESQRQYQDRSCGEPYDQNSRDDDIIYGGEHSDWSIHKCDVTSGWLIDVNSIRWEETTRIGDVAGPNNISQLSTSNTAVVTFDTRHHGWGSSGHVAGYLKFREYRDVPTPHESDPITRNLDWGKQIVFEIPVGSTFKCIYTQFDGTNQEFAGPFSNKYINVTTAGNSVTIKSLSEE